MTPTEMELRDQLEDLENQLADLENQLADQDVMLVELTEENLRLEKALEEARRYSADADTVIDRATRQLVEAITRAEKAEARANHE